MRTEENSLALEECSRRKYTSILSSMGNYSLKDVMWKYSSIHYLTAHLASSTEISRNCSSSFQFQYRFGLQWYVLSLWKCIPWPLCHWKAAFQLYSKPLMQPHLFWTSAIYFLVTHNLEGFFFYTRSEYRVDYNTILHHIRSATSNHLLFTAYV